ncbi:sulfite reductase [Mycobacterium intracellulare]|uniref:nitrite/sulfite reductase n=1 Tax=Mycobacterium intracellulare TaxID=1767 RepID=UPI000BAF5AE3|nr:nitrite/sulfite reductase [Mycobacterium intracellulare]PBA31977.1 sulfite reductase [Mycobacterium intracellulare]
MTAARPVKTRNEGQWALGDREPLNDTEKIKNDDGPLNVRDRIINVYSKQGFDSIDKSDLRGRFRWMGLYTQREQGYDGSWTGDENTDKIEAKYFMMRVRSDGKAMTAHTMRTLGQISTEFARDTADISDRENLQLHWVRIEDVPEIWRRLDSVGLQTTEACGDCPRGIHGSPLAGDSLDEVLDPSAAIDEIVRRSLNNPEYANLPRKYKTAVSGLQDVSHETHDIAFVGVHHPEHGPGLDLWVGGGLSTNPMLAQRLGVWVPLNEVPDVWEAVTQLFRDYGYRRLIDGPAPTPVKHTIDHVGVQRIKNGLNAVGVAPIAGRVSGSTLSAVADLMEKAGSDRARWTPFQKLVILDVADDKVNELVAGLDALGLPSRPSSWRKNTMACTGIEYCKLSFAETRVRTQTLVPELEQRLADVESRLDAPISVHLNGCPNSCARIQVADIGFKGQWIDDGDGNSVEGFQVHLGGGLGEQSGFGRKLRQHKVTSAELGDYIDRVTRKYLEKRDSGEAFASWALRAEEDDLR